MNHSDPPVSNPSSSNPTMARPSGPKKGMNPLVLVFLLSGGFFILFLVISAFVFMSGSNSEWEGDSSGALFSGRQASVAVVEVKGVIMESEKVLKRLKSLKKMDSVKAVVLRLETPGGSVAPSQEIYEAIKAFPKPVVASMGSVAASGGYYIACGAKKVFANAGTLTGSIGVIMGFSNMEKLYDWAKIKPFVIKTGRYKDSGASYREMAADERALLQKMIDDVWVQFKTAVKEGRNLPMDQVDAVADGRIMTGIQAHQAKLVDEVGTFEDAILAAAEMGGIQGEPQVIYPSKPSRGLLQYFLDGSDEDAESSVIPSFLSRRKSVQSAVDVLGDRVRVTLTPGVYWLWNGAY